MNKSTLQSKPNLFTVVFYGALIALILSVFFLPIFSYSYETDKMSEGLTWHTLVCQKGDEEADVECGCETNVSIDGLKGEVSYTSVGSAALVNEIGIMIDNMDFASDLIKDDMSYIVIFMMALIAQLFLIIWLINAIVVIVNSVKKIIPAAKAINDPKAVVAGASMKKYIKPIVGLFVASFLLQAFGLNLIMEKTMVGQSDKFSIYSALSAFSGFNALVIIPVLFGALMIAAYILPKKLGAAPAPAAEAAPAPAAEVKDVEKDMDEKI